MLHVHEEIVHVRSQEVCTEDGALHIRDNTNTLETSAYTYKLRVLE